MLTVRNALRLFTNERLRDLCRDRGVVVGGSKEDLVTRLVREYKNNMEALLQDLSAEDMVDVALASFSDDVIRSFVLAASSRTRRPPAAPAEPIQLYSTGAEGATNRLGLPALDADAKRASRTTIISAYYALNTLEWLFSRGNNVRFVTNGLGGKRLEEQIEELMRLQAALAKHKGGVEIRLAFSPGIFHTKLYLFEHKTNLVAWVGSANATEAGFGGHNEEILTRLEPAPESFLRYAEQAWNKGRPLEDHRTEVSSLVSFYRTGDIYYRPYTHLRVSVNPFRPLLRRLPSEETAKLSRFRSVYADAEAGIGAFNARLVYAANGGRANTLTKPARIRPYAIETCYGYWVPDKFIDQVEDTLQRSSEAKERFLVEFLAWTKGEGREQTVAAFQDYLRAAKQAMDENDVEWREYAGDLERVFDENSPAEQCILDIQEQLGSKVDIEKHSRAFVSGRLPEVWDDAVARSHFEQTFFESLEAESAKPVRKWPAAEWILGGIGILEQTPANIIKSELERYLSTEDWFESHL